MVILELGKVEINTKLDHTAHKEAIEKVTTFYCTEDAPEQWFTQNSPDKKAMHGGSRASRFFKLHYNEEGSELLKVDSYDYIDHAKKMVRRRKDVDEKCYFSRNKAEEICDVFELVEETDYNSPNTVNEITWWAKGDKEPNLSPVIPTHEPEKKKKRWGLF